MRVSVIASGSNGNSCLVSCKKASVLIDAGKSGIEIESRMNRLGESLSNVDAILLTHSHHDHITGAGVLSRRYDIPIYMSRAVYSCAGFKLGDVSYKLFNRDFKINGLKIKPVNTSHNVSSNGFVVNNFGLMTDTGIVTSSMKKVISKLKGVLLESNHDIDMLINGSYPAFLKKWILSSSGHLSNIAACSFLNEKGKNLNLVLLGHLSENNNTKKIVKKTYESLVKRKIEYEVCSREKESGGFEF